MSRRSCTGDRLMAAFYVNELLLQAGAAQRPGAGAVRPAMGACAREFADGERGWRGPCAVSNATCSTRSASAWRGTRRRRRIASRPPRATGSTRKSGRCADLRRDGDSISAAKPCLALAGRPDARGRSRLAGIAPGAARRAGRAPWWSGGLRSWGLARRTGAVQAAPSGLIAPATRAHRCAAKSKAAQGMRIHRILRERIHGRGQSRGADEAATGLELVQHCLHGGRIVLPGAPAAAARRSDGNSSRTSFAQCSTAQRGLRRWPTRPAASSQTGNLPRRRFADACGAARPAAPHRRLQQRDRHRLEQALR